MVIYKKADKIGNMGWEKIIEDNIISGYNDRKKGGVVCPTQRNILPVDLIDSSFLEQKNLVIICSLRSCIQVIHE